MGKYRFARGLVSKMKNAGVSRSDMNKIRQNIRDIQDAGTFEGFDDMSFEDSMTDWLEATVDYALSGDKKYEGILSNTISENKQYGFLKGTKLEQQLQQKFDAYEKERLGRTTTGSSSKPVQSSVTAVPGRTPPRPGDAAPGEQQLDEWQQRVVQNASEGKPVRSMEGVEADFAGQSGNSEAIPVSKSAKSGGSGSGNLPPKRRKRKKRPQKQSGGSGNLPAASGGNSGGSVGPDYTWDEFQGKYRPSSGGKMNAAERYMTKNRWDEINDDFARMQEAKKAGNMDEFNSIAGKYNGQTTRRGLQDFVLNKMQKEGPGISDYVWGYKMPQTVVGAGLIFGLGSEIVGANNGQKSNAELYSTPM